MSLEQELQSEQVVHLDLSGFSQTARGTTVRATIAKMREARHNVCLITDDSKLVGIFTDRDVLRKVMPYPQTLDQPIENLMTPSPITIQPNSTAADALDLMDANHFRNLPAVQKDGTIVGNMTHQAIIRYLADLYPVEVLNQPPRPDQFPSQPEGG